MIKYGIAFLSASNSGFMMNSARLNGGDGKGVCVFAHGIDGSRRADNRIFPHCIAAALKQGKTLDIPFPELFPGFAFHQGQAAFAQDHQIDFLLVETDSPFLTPVPFRGKRNMPVYVEHTAQKVADIKGISLEEAAAKTKENAIRFYGIDE